MYACVPETIRLIVKTSHATFPQFGVVANAMAVEAYQKLKEMVMLASRDTAYIWSVGRISGGHVHNVISDLCEMDISAVFTIWILQSVWIKRQKKYVQLLGNILTVSAKQTGI